jgi:hypothetical protein
MPPKEDLLQYAIACAQPARAYWLKRFDAGGDMYAAVQLYRVLRILNPTFVRNHILTSDELVVMNLPEKHFDKDVIMNDFASYKLCAIDTVVPQDKTLENGSVTSGVQIWWAENNGRCGIWKEIARAALLISPSSATVERVFSRLSYQVSDLQRSQLLDLIELGIMAYVNPPL